MGSGAAGVGKGKGPYLLGLVKKEEIAVIRWPEAETVSP
jgi:hypothetical protein